MVQSGRTNVCDFDDDEWNDADLTAIDLSVAMAQLAVTQSNTGVQPASVTSSAAVGANQSNKTTKPDPVASSAGIGSTASVPDPVGNANNRSEFSDDDDAFAQVDFSELDNKIEQHQLMTQQFHSLATVHPMPPPLEAPIRNRRHDEGSSNHVGCGPMFLSFDRYVVRSVWEDVQILHWQLPQRRSVHAALWLDRNSKFMARGSQ